MGQFLQKTDPLSDLQTRTVHAIHACILHVCTVCMAQDKELTLRPKGPPPISTLDLPILLFMLVRLLVLTAVALSALDMMQLYLEVTVHGKRAIAPASSLDAVTQGLFRFIYIHIYI